jgi:hypothetical protein
MATHEREALVRRVEAFKWMLALTTDRLAREAIEHQVATPEARLVEMDGAAQPSSRRG